jgi:hypothetical protein
MDAQSEGKLNEIDSTLADLVRQLADAVSQYGGTIQVISGYRSYEKQAALYANRASNRNPVARPGTSKHEQGLAVDLRISGVATDTVGMLGESLGLKWGGRFSKPDPGHFELTDAATPESADDSTSMSADDSAPGWYDDSAVTDEPSVSGGVWLVAGLLGLLAVVLIYE